MHLTQRHYRISDLTDYINWVYFFHAWSMPATHAALAALHPCAACAEAWVGAQPESAQPQARQGLNLFRDAQRMLARLTPHLQIQALFRLCPARSDGDDIVLFPRQADETRLPMLRRQTPDSNGLCPCLADFIRPLSPCGETAADASPATDPYGHIGLFATTVRPLQGDAETDSDNYHALLLQTLSDRLAEAAAERLHQEVRTLLWGYAPSERLTMLQLHNEQFQGIRPAVGYPSLPDISLNFLLQPLLQFSLIGISLTEHAMMTPHASVSGLMLAHPKARYFDVGTISPEQLADYARRRGLAPEALCPYLAANLKH